MVNDHRLRTASASLFAPDARSSLATSGRMEMPSSVRQDPGRVLRDKAPSNSQSQLKQFLHSHIVDLTGPGHASGTGMLYVLRGRR